MIVFGNMLNTNEVVLNLTFDVKVVELLYHRNLFSKYKAMKNILDLIVFPKKNRKNCFFQISKNLLYLFLRLKEWMIRF
jgi:hypothetical protein